MLYYYHMSKQVQIWITKEAKQELEAMNARTNTARFRLASDAIMLSSLLLARCTKCDDSASVYSSEALHEVRCECGGLMRIER